MQEFVLLKKNNLYQLKKNWTLTWKVVTIWVNFVATIEAMGGFQLLDLIITELKSHMTCYNSMPLIALVEITAFRLESKSRRGFFLTNKISTNERP